MKGIKSTYLFDLIEYNFCSLKFILSYPDISQCHLVTSDCNVNLFIPFVQNCGIRNLYSKVFRIQGDFISFSFKIHLAFYALLTCYQQKQDNAVY